MPSGRQHSRNHRRLGKVAAGATAVVAAVAAALLAVAVVSTEAPAALSVSPGEHIYTPIPTFAQACCKVCRKGKACGDTCISRDKTCNVGRGCACDG